MGFTDKTKPRSRVRVKVEPPTRVRVTQDLQILMDLPVPPHVEEPEATLEFGGKKYGVHPDVARYVQDLFQHTFSISTRLHEKHQMADAMLTMEMPKIRLGVPKPKRVRV